MSCTIGRSRTLGLNSSGDVRTRFEKRGRGLRPLADEESALMRFDWLAAGVHVKQREAAFLRRGLRVIPARFERRSGFRRETRGLAGLLDLAGKDMRDERFGRRIGGVEHDQPARAEHGFEPAAKRIGHAGPGCIGAAEAVNQRRRELGRRHRGFERADRGVHRFVQAHAGDRTGVRLWRIAGGNGERLHVRIEHAARLDLVPVVIFGVDPEHRDRRHAVLGPHLLGESNRGQRFQQREEWSAEETGLLAGDDGNGLADREVGQLPRSPHLRRRELRC